MDAPSAPAYSELPPLVNKDPAIANGFSDDVPSYAAASGSSNGVASRFKKGLLGKSCIAIHTDNASVSFLHPIGATATDPIPETTVSGYAILKLTAPKQVKSFTISLVGVEDIGFPLRGYESHTYLEQELTLPLSLGDHAELPAGTYPFPYSFKVPGTSAPFQRCRYGRTRTKVVAKAKGAGIMGGTVEADQWFDLTANVGWVDPQKELSLDLQVEGVSNDLGPYRLHIHSPLFVVSSLVSFRFKLPSVPQALTIHSFRVVIEQSWHLISPTAKDKRTGEMYSEQPPPDKILVALVDANHKPDAVGSVCIDGSTCEGVSEAIPGKRLAALARLDPGEDWEITHVARLPPDDTLRPTTHFNTVANIRASHMLVFETIYTNEAGVRRTLVIRKPVYLNSCCCLLASVLLPSYEGSDPCPENADVRRIASCGVCLCGTSLGDLKSAQNPTQHLDDAIMPSVIVPIKSDDERAQMSPGVRF